MASSKTTLKPGDNLPPRGKAKKTLILEALKTKGLLGLRKNSTDESAEKAFFGEIAQVAFGDKDNSNSGMCIKLLADKGWASVKPSCELVSFDFDHESDVHVQAAQLVKAIAVGDLAPDIGNALIQSIRAMMGIEADTIIKDRIDKIESALNGG